MTMGNFPWVQVLPLLRHNRTICRGILGAEVATQGSGPYEEAEFDAFLQRCGIEVRHVSGGDAPPEVVIVGREAWNADDIDELFERTYGNVLIYSQEMVVASMAIGMDIYELLDDNTRLVEFIDGHPALERFHYPQDDETNAYLLETPIPELEYSEPEVNSYYQLVVDFDTGSWPASGVLSAMGYHVGRNGLAPAARRAILEQAFQVELVAASADAVDYIQEWGSPRSQQRLNKMANCLIGFARAARRRSGDYSEAISDWESDLEWLSENCHLL